MVRERLRLSAPRVYGTDEGINNGRRGEDGYKGNSRPQVLFPEQHIRRNEHEEQHRDNSIHREERGIQFGQIVWLHQGVLVNQ